jgi:hypothetical protein
MSLQLNDPQLNEAIKAAIWNTLTGEKKDELLQNAISQLLDVPEPMGRWDKNPKSPLQEAFNRAANQIARETAKKWLLEDETKKKEMEQLFEKAWEKFLSRSGPGVGGPDELIDKIADRLSSAFER